jgi:hypothetical protein
VKKAVLFFAPILRCQALALVNSFTCVALLYGYIIMQLFPWYSGSVALIIKNRYKKSSNATANTNLLSGVKLHLIMKISILILCLFLMAVACKKDTALQTMQQQVTGKWELVRSISGWGGTREFEAGNGNTITFTGNNFTQQVIGTDTIYNFEGTFTIYTAKPCDFAAETTLINFSGLFLDTYPQQIKFTDNGELSFGATECIADGGTSYYKKIR